MADDILSIDKLVGSTGNITSTTLDILLYVILVAVVIGIVWFIWFIFQHKYKVEIMLLTGGKDVARDDRAREIEVDGGKFWKLLKSKALIERPPAKAIYTDSKGRVRARCFQTDADNYVWQSSETPDGIKDKDKYFENYSPLTTKQRGILVHQLRKSEDRKRKNIKEYIPMIVGLGSVVIIIVCMLIYWENIAKPAVEINKIAEVTMGHIADISNSQKEIAYRQEELAKQLGIEVNLKQQGEAPD